MSWPPFRQIWKNNFTLPTNTMGRTPWGGHHGASTMGRVPWGEHHVKMIWDIIIKYSYYNVTLFCNIFTFVRMSNSIFFFFYNRDSRMAYQTESPMVENNIMWWQAYDTNMNNILRYILRQIWIFFLYWPRTHN